MFFSVTRVDASGEGGSVNWPIGGKISLKNHAEMGQHSNSVEITIYFRKKFGKGYLALITPSYAQSGEFRNIFEV